MDWFFNIGLPLYYYLRDIVHAVAYSQITQAMVFLAFWMGWVTRRRVQWDSN
jgi:hypothetical protein